MEGESGEPVAAEVAVRWMREALEDAVGDDGIPDRWMSIKYDRFVEFYEAAATLRARVEELEKDRERLDWIFADPFAVINVKGAYDYEEVEDREQLDAARASAGERGE